MQMADAGQNDDTMWQGYVSAISCLLLALLLLMAILSISLVVASSAEKSADEAQATAPPERRASASERKGFNPARGARWSIHFPGQTVVIGQDQRTQFAAQLATAKPAQLWHVFAYSEESNSAAQRLAYMRILATRDLLLESGIAAKNIELQLLSPAAQLGRNPAERSTTGLVYVKPGKAP